MARSLVGTLFARVHLHIPLGCDIHESLYAPMIAHLSDFK